ncbi:hypothetical protein IVB12_11365 [Bradyrhizobium sp. 179]|uniref:hypothetical protein n=1 Tax=Bradyrhizobium sp. 179 TaxID=2782648 RepID=UPI001FFA72C5|nr:hypothetical protein [Bradyrhizobium sp. 179]MCK1542529.1 hypothetical protein [Bradyrhizobium sp. 179]
MISICDLFSTGAFTTRSGRPRLSIPFQTAPAALRDKDAERHPLEVQAGGADVLAEVAGADLEAGFSERCEEFGYRPSTLSGLARFYEGLSRRRDRAAESQ